MTYETIIIIVLAIMVVALLAICIAGYHVIEDEKEIIKGYYVRCNNLLCDYEDEIDDLKEIQPMLRKYFLSLEDQDDDMLPDNQDW